MSFQLGRVVWTRYINDCIADNALFAEFVLDSLKRHANCDWGELSIEDKKENILEATLPEFKETKSETFILTQIEILKSYYIRDWVAKALIDSVKNNSQNDFVHFYLCKVIYNGLICILN